MFVLLLLHRTGLGSGALAAAIAVPVGVVLLAAGLLLLVCCRRRRRLKLRQQQQQAASADFGKDSVGLGEVADLEAGQPNDLQGGMQDGVVAGRGSLDQVSVCCGLLRSQLSAKSWVGIAYCSASMPTAEYVLYVGTAASFPAAATRRVSRQLLGCCKGIQSVSLCAVVQIKALALQHKGDSFSSNNEPDAAAGAGAAVQQLDSMRSRGFLAASGSDQQDQPSAGGLLAASSSRLNSQAIHGSGGPDGSGGGHGSGGLQGSGGMYESSTYSTGVQSTRFGTAASQRSSQPGGMDDPLHSVSALLKARSDVAVLRDLKIGPLLGRGSFGRVYKGHWKATPVAVKIIEHHAAGARSSGGKTISAGRETLLATSVSHPNVVSTAL